MTGLNCTPMMNQTLSFAAARAGNVAQAASRSQKGQAARATLRDKATLRKQLARMIADPKIERFTQSFPRQWLQLHRVGEFPPDE